MSISSLVASGSIQVKAMWYEIVMLSNVDIEKTEIHTGL